MESLKKLLVNWIVIVFIHHYITAVEAVTEGEINQSFRAGNLLVPVDVQTVVCRL